MTQVERYIRENWNRAIYKDESGAGFAGVDLPHRYSSASIKGEGRFYFFFYWDTYFTNPGLLAHGHHRIARENIQNMLWLIDSQGYMPNHVGIHNRSQPPFLCKMVEDYLRVMRTIPTQDSPSLAGRAAIASLVSPDDSSDRIDLHAWADDWDSEFYRACVTGIRREYQFWQTARLRPSGLAGYGHHESADGAISFYDKTLVKRLGVSAGAPLESKAAVGSHFIGEAESGWDFCQRFSGRCLDHSAVDLNALLYGYERFLACAAEQLGWGSGSSYEERAEKRLRLANELLWDETIGWFFDYDESRRTRSDVLSLAGMTPLVLEFATADQAALVAGNLARLEREHGIAVTDDREGSRSFQWAYPNVWPCQVFLAVSGLARYGRHEDACRVARKYLDTTDRLFARTGMLWEKTDAETGEIAGGEYDAVPMLGWTAGTYLALTAYVESIALADQ